MAVKTTPEGYHSVTPYLICKDAGKALEFYKKAFGAEELSRHEMPDGKVGHAEIKIGDSPVMLADEFPEMNALSPQTIGGSPVSLMVYVDDVDAVFKRALGAGARETRPVADQFYGDRLGMLTDPFGHVWSVATHIEDVPPEEMKRRADEAARKGRDGA